MTRQVLKMRNDATAGGDLLSMLSFKRPAGSKTEKQFIKRFIEPLGAKRDAFGNYRLQVGDAPVLWSCHTDTVHVYGGRQQLAYIGPNLLGIDPDSKSNCLGADDTAGVWLMTEMIRANVPGRYIFHRSEEIGALGSKWIAKNNPEILKDMKCAIALDRKGKTDVITHQGSRTCSDLFAESLAKQLGMGYKPSSLGMYTDTKSYINDIGECTNLSVGYQGAHTSNEQLDEKFLFELRERLLVFDVDKIEQSRKPGEVEAYTYRGGSYYGDRKYYDYDRGHGEWDGWEEYFRKKYPSAYAAPSTHTTPKALPPPANHSTLTIEGYCRRHPEVVADILEEFGIDAKYLGDEVAKRLHQDWIPE